MAKDETTGDDKFFKPPKSLKDLNPATSNIREKRKGSKPARINFVPQQFDQLIEDQGVYVRITPSILCPNRTSLTDTNHALDCPICNGEQLIDVADQALECWAVIQGINFKQLPQMQGIYDVKDAHITTQQGVKLFYWYKIEVLDFAAPYNQLMKRASTGDVDRTRYEEAPVDALIFDEAKGTKTLATPDIPILAIDAKGIHYSYNKEFTIKGRELRWKSAKRPDPGTLYTLIYAVLPTFRVLDLNHEHRYYYVDFKRTNKVPVHLPQEAIIRWDYLAKGSGNQVPVAPGSAPGVAE